MSMRPPSVDPLITELGALKLNYDLGENNLEPLGTLAVNCLGLLSEIASIVPQGQLQFRGQRKPYVAFELGSKRSRPVRRELLIHDPSQFSTAWQKLCSAVDPRNRQLTGAEVDAAIYTATQSFSCAIDLLRPGSRKTPGTHFEILVGTLLGAVSGLERAKQVRVPEKDYTVPTDIVFLRTANDPGPGLVVPTKITTRERVVQPFAHQRILDEVFGRGTYRSIMVIVSETQRNDGGLHGLNEICVPNQIGLFQEYLAELCGMYYLDPPHAYATAKFTEFVPVRTVGQLLGSDLPGLLTP